MDAALAIKIGEDIAERYAKGIVALKSAAPDATTDQLVAGNHVWLAAEIMKAICDATAELKPSA